MKEKLKLLLQVIIAHIARIVFRAFYIFPIKDNRILFQAFREKQYACNPKYISEALNGLYGDEYEIGWTFRNPEKFAYLAEQGVRVMKAGSLRAYYYALTAKVICVNTYYKPTLPRRRGQYYIRTWHGGGAYKRVGKMMKLPPLERYYIGMQQQGADLYLSSSRAFTELTLRESFGYTGEVLEKGMPRNDMLMSQHRHLFTARVRKRLNLQENDRLVLYAPTYRSDIRPHSFGIDYERLTASLEKRFGGKWICAYRGHHITHRSDQSASAGTALNLTDYPDMQELLLAADVLITDYSSSIWDMSLMFKPTFLYATDLGDYKADRDFYTDIHDWPFSLAENNDELEKNILEFDEEAYRTNVRAHHDSLGSYETGRASEICAMRIRRVCAGGKR